MPGALTFPLWHQMMQWETATPKGSQCAHEAQKTADSGVHSTAAQSGTSSAPLKYRRMLCCACDNKTENTGSTSSQAMIGSPSPPACDKIAWRRRLKMYCLRQGTWKRDERRALQPLHRSPWVLEYPHSHQMIPQTNPRGDRRVLDKVEFLKIFRCH